VDGVADFDVSNVQVYNGYVLHTGTLKYGVLTVGDEVVASYDEVSRTAFSLPALIMVSAAPLAAQK
jgi:alanyl-tRNA synthetase